MKTRNSFIKIAVLSGALLLSACEGFLDINESPNAVTSVPPRFQLTSVTAGVGFHMGSDIHRYSSIFAQQFTGGGGVGIQTVEFSQFNITATDVNNVWRNAFYGELLADLQKLREATQATSPRYAGIAKILQVYLFAMAVDAWGDIPYTQALQFAGNTQPVYDNDEQVYQQLFGLLDSGLTDLAAATNLLTPGADDLIYGGSVTLWRKFANSLRLRMLIKYYPSQATFANTEIAAFLAGKTDADFIASNAENFQLAFESTTNRTNSIDQFERRRLNQFWPTTTFVTLMGASDPRRPFYFTNTASGIVGLTPGSTVVSPSTSRMHTFLRGAVTGTNPNTGYAGDAPQRMLTYSEHNFNMAEYYHRSGDLTKAQEYYEKALRASLTMTGVSETNITAFITSPVGTLPADATDRLRRIIEQKYIANYGVPMEPWSDWRRTGFPVIAAPSNAVLPAIPRVLPYSDLERVTNPVNTPVRDRDDLTERVVFWDQN